MNRAEIEKLIKELHTVADEVEPFLPAVAISCFRVEIEHDEVGVGLETLLTEIYEYDVVVSKRAYEILEKARRGNLIDDSYFDGIQHRED